MAIFPTSFFRQYRPGKCLLWYSRTKKSFLRYKNKKFKKSKNWHFSKGVNAWLRSKDGLSSNFFLGNIGHENVFYDILEWENAFQGHKNKKFKKSKNWHFSKRVNPWFLTKNGHFSNFFFSRQYRTGKCLLWYPRTKSAFPGYKNKKFKKSKKWNFSKGVSPWFWSKNAHFFKFIF